jgi:MFS-type transporter involved in bile tolerance (Atg22 family)
MPSIFFTASGTGVAIAFVNSIGNTSGLAGPWLLGRIADLTGDTRLGLYCMAGFFIASAIGAFLLCKAAEANANRDSPKVAG